MGFLKKSWGTISMVPLLGIVAFVGLDIVAAYLRTLPYRLLYVPLPPFLLYQAIIHSAAENLA